MWRRLRKPEARNQPSLLLCVHERWRVASLPKLALKPGERLPGALDSNQQRNRGLYSVPALDHQGLCKGGEFRMAECSQRMGLACGCCAHRLALLYPFLHTG